MAHFAGLDWGGGKHAVCIVDEQGRVVAAFEVTHDSEGLTELRRRLGKHGEPASVPIAIERPSGLLVDTLVEAGHVVVPIHPNVVKACRPRYRAAGGKDDRGDAYLLADVLRTDGHRLRPLRQSSDEMKALRALVRTRDDLVAQRVAMANQLRALLQSFWPGALAIFADVDSAIALAFIARFPTPKAAAALGHKRLAAFLAQHSYTGRRQVAELLERLRGAAVGLCGAAEVEAKGELVLAFVAIIDRLVGELAKITARIERSVTALDDGQIVMSFPRAGRVCAAQILAELGDERARFPSEEQLAAEAGVAPVTHASGKQRGVKFRWACNHRLRKAITCFADNSRHESQWASHVYASARARGCDHPHAIRVLARAWVRVLWRAWHQRTPYNPSVHGGALRLRTAA
jgi:transposase